jgi:hypothetical protein
MNFDMKPEAIKNVQGSLLMHVPLCSRFSGLQYFELLVEIV